MSDIPAIGPVRSLNDELRPVSGAARRDPGVAFGDALREAVETVDELQQRSEAAQAAFAAGEEQELHDVLIKVEQAEIAFRTMMEVRNKLVDAYREIMRMGAGG